MAYRHPFSYAILANGVIPFVSCTSRQNLKLITRESRWAFEGQLVGVIRHAREQFDDSRGQARMEASYSAMPVISFLAWL
jgi:hypothetical protein